MKRIVYREIRHGTNTVGAIWKVFEVEVRTSFIGEKGSKQHNRNRSCSQKMAAREKR